MRKLSLIVAALLLSTSGALSQVTPGPVLDYFINSAGISVPASPANPFPVNAAVSVSASISGFEQTSPTSFATISANGTSAPVALPAGTSVVVFNVGSNVGYVNLGITGFTASASTTPIQPGSWWSQTVGTATNLAAYSPSGTSFIIIGGAGLPAGAGGGSSGGGGGGNVNVTQLAGNATATGAGAITSGTLRITTAAGSVIAIDQSNPNVSGGTNDVFVDPSSNISATVTGQISSLTQDGAGNGITSTSGALDVNLKSGGGTNLATTTLQTSGNSSLTSIASSNTTIASNTTNAATTTLQTAGNTSASTTATNTGTIATNTSTIATNTGAANTTLSTISTHTTNSGTPTIQAGSAIIGKISQVDSGGSDATDATNHAIKVNIVAGGASNASIGVIGSTAPTSATAMGVKDGSGNLQIPSSANPIPVTGGVAQGSTTSGQNVALTGGAVTTSAPTDTTATTAPLSLTTAGEVRVDCTTGCSGGGGGGTSSNYGSAFPTAGTAIGAKNGANMVNLAADGSNNLDVNLQTPIPAGSAVIGALVANQSVNLAQVSGTTATAGAGAVSAGAQRVAVGQDTTTIAGSAPGAAGTPSTNVVSIQGVSSGTVVPISGTVQIGNTPNTTPILASNNAGGNTQTVKAASASPALTDPSAVVSLSPNPSPVCTGVLAINQTTSTDLHTFTNIGYICSVMLVSASAQNISLDEGTGTVCGTSPTALIGGTTASLALAANGGFSMVSDRTVIKMQASADHLCVQQSSSGNVSGVITYQDHS